MEVTGQALLDKVRETVRRNKQLMSNSNNGASRSRVSYLQEGTHRVRLITDPIGELHREVLVHKAVRKWVHCPGAIAFRHLNDMPKCGFCDIATVLGDWRLKRRISSMVYGHLISTTAEGDYWKPGNTYCIIGTGKLSKAIMPFLEATVEDSPDFIMSMLNPKVTGGYVTISFTKGNQGTVTITPVIGRQSGPIETGDWWVPLTDVVVPVQFNRDEFLAAEKEFLAQYYDETGQLRPQYQAQAAKVQAELAAARAAEAAKNGAMNSSEAMDTTTSTHTTASAVAEMPVYTLENPPPNLPHGCPGFGNYNPGFATCIVCDFNEACMNVKR